MESEIESLCLGIIYVPYVPIQPFEWHFQQSHSFECSSKCLAFQSGKPANDKNKKNDSEWLAKCWYRTPLEIQQKMPPLQCAQKKSVVSNSCSYNLLPTEKTQFHTCWIKYLPPPLIDNLMKVPRKKHAALICIIDWITLFSKRIHGARFFRCSCSLNAIFHCLPMRLYSLFFHLGLFVIIKFYNTLWRETIEAAATWYSLPQYLYRFLFFISLKR